jgi:hypothetical protein
MDSREIYEIGSLGYFENFVSSICKVTGAAPGTTSVKMPNQPWGAGDHVWKRRVSESRLRENCSMIWIRPPPQYPRMRTLGLRPFRLGR